MSRIGSARPALGRGGAPRSSGGGGPLRGVQIFKCVFIPHSCRLPLDNQLLCQLTLINVDLPHANICSMERRDKPERSEGVRARHHEGYRPAVALSHAWAFVRASAK